MTRSSIAIVVAALLLTSCAREEEFVEPDSFSFVVYPGSRYLGELTEVTRQAHKLVKPNDEPPPVAIYDTDASVEEVASFYAKAYGYESVAPDATNNLSVTKPNAYYRMGELANDIQGVREQLPKLGLTTDASKAQGSYKAAEIQARPNRPHVTVQRPYFNVRTSEVVDRTIILMAR